MDLAGCDEIGQRQDGLILRRQARQILTDDQIDRLLSQKIWHPIIQGTFRMTGVSDTWHRRVRAASLLRERALVARHSAAFLHGLIERQPKDVDLLVRMSDSARLVGVTVRRTRTWPVNSNRIDGINMTTAARTLIDIASHCSLRTLENATDLAFARRLLSVEDLLRELENVGAKGRGRCKLLLTILESFDERFARVGSHKEIPIFKWIVDAGLPEPTPQFRIPVSAYETFIPDWAYPHWKIAIEVQSWTWHGGPVRQQRDIRRAAQLMALGWRIVPVLPHDVTRSDFLSALRNVISDREQSA